MLPPCNITLKRSPDNINVVEPDLIVICDLEENLNGKNYYMGVLELVTEIISDSTYSKDFIKKLDLYMSTGVGEYWIINLFNKEITIYYFKNNDIAKNETHKKNEIASSFNFEGLTINIRDIFR